MNKIFDNAFRTLCERNPRLLIPIVNECFEKNYSFDEKIDLLSGEHHIMPNAENEDTKEIITDSCIRVCDRLYHIECQSNDDGTMVLRMVEYDTLHLAMSEAYSNGFLSDMICRILVNMQKRLLLMLPKKIKWSRRELNLLWVESY